jgi:translation initiation factor IF-2
MLRTCNRPNPLSVLGLDGAATAGDKFNVFEDESQNKLVPKLFSNTREQSVLHTTSYYYGDEIDVERYQL